MKKILIALTTILVLPITALANADEINIAKFEDGENLQIAIKTDGIQEESIGLAFELYYDSLSLEYLSYDLGNFFEQGGEPIYLVSEGFSEKGSKIVAGITLRRTDAQVSASGDIIFLNFKILKKTESTLDFEHTVISRIDENGKRKDLENINWINYEITFSEEVKTVGIIVEAQAVPETKPNLFSASLIAIPDLPIAIPITIASILICIGVCYILFRKFKKSNAIKTSADTRIEKPSEESPSAGDWAGI
ncbi:MAG: hypothetical protein ACD_51C00109G0002 [uncultured bacterium]|nr:MAG: hypothetical protein ACD_51C00109G0002 [uncultured bacterium]KKT02701.1 MAG: hypothetical protein UV80_C0002G0168 [Candidatus Peregrinibacteria bacterium GW2011_GWF2_43_17]HAU39788.1 hypothetical protein [Candidatus Peregrinibacteria bacterium]